MSTALIGHTGFVGGTLSRMMDFDACFNSADIEAIAGQSFGLVMCAGVSAVKWQANQAPEADRAGIARLTAALDKCDIHELVLISTIDVYPRPGDGGDESTPVDASANHAYGRHRYELEQWCVGRFRRVRILRLPALFGPGLRKNAIFDLLHGHMLDSINPAGTFQWYPTRRLWADIAQARRLDVPLVNLFPEPIRMQAIIDAAFPGTAVGPPLEPGPRYDMQTRHARRFGGDGRYIMDAEAVLSELSAFVQEFRA